jgi:hypothetical protein
MTAHQPGCPATKGGHLAMCRCAPKLSKTQQEVVDYLRTHGAGCLCRWPGGFWTTTDTKLPGGSEIGRVDGYNYSLHGAPVWYVTIGTVRALEKKGVLGREHVFAHEWNDIRRLVVTP